MFGMARLFLRFFLRGETRCPLARRNDAKRLNAVGKRTRLPPDICAFGDYCHRLRRSRSTFDCHFARDTRATTAVEAAVSAAMGLDSAGRPAFASLRLGGHACRHRGGGD
jgi:hypothetical protein